MNERGLVHPSMLLALGSDFFPVSVTIEAATETQAANGQVTLTWSAALTGLAGRLGPANAAQERRLPSLVVTNVSHVLALAGNYAIATAQRAVVDGVAFNILAVQHDGNSATTWLGLEVVSG